MVDDRLPAMVLVVLAVLALGAAAATLDSGEIPSGDVGNGSADPGGSSAPPDTPGADATGVTDPIDFELWVPPLDLVLGTLVLALGGALAFLFVRTDTYETVEPTEPTGDDGVDLNAVGQAAGEAADRIEAQADVDNEVYRAWREMVGLLEVPEPATTTPEEFERHAVAAGMNADDVTELTRLFGEVRYGERDPEEREKRAVTALRDIEATYADGTDADEGATDGTNADRMDEDGTNADGRQDGTNANGGQDE